MQNNNPNQSFDFGLKIEISKEKNQDLFQFQHFYGFSELKNMKQQQQHHNNQQINQKSEISIPKVLQKTNSQIDLKKQTTPTFCKPNVDQKFTFTFKKQFDHNQSKGSGSQKIVRNEIQQQIQCLNTEIIFYCKNSQKFEYESNKLREKQIEIIHLDKTLEEKLISIKNDLQDINTNSEEIQTYANELKKTIETIQYEKQGLIKQIRQELKYQINNDNIAEEEKAIYQQLQKLEQSVKDIERNPQSYLLSLLTEKQQSLYVIKDQSAQKIYNLSLKTKDAKFIYNVKLACLRQRWILLQNEHIQLGIVYEKDENQIVIQIHIGNKYNKQLSGFTLTQIQNNKKGKKIYSNQVLAAKNYLKTEKIQTDFIERSCFQFEIEYQVKEKIYVSAVIPISFLHFGSFQVIPISNFNKKWKDCTFKQKSQECAMDNQLLSNVLEIKKYLYNLLELTSKKNQRYLAGYFKFEYTQLKGKEIMIKFKQNNGMIKFVIGAYFQIHKSRAKRILQNLKLIFSI